MIFAIFWVCNNFLGFKIFLKRAKIWYYSTNRKICWINTDILSLLGTLIREILKKIALALFKVYKKLESWVKFIVINLIS